MPSLNRALRRERSELVRSSSACFSHWSLLAVSCFARLFGTRKPFMRRAKRYASRLSRVFLKRAAHSGMHVKQVWERRLRSGLKKTRGPARRSFRGIPGARTDIITESKTGAPESARMLLAVLREASPHLKARGNSLCPKAVLPGRASASWKVSSGIRIGIRII
jgi:hypothetical protein